VNRPPLRPVLCHVVPLSQIITAEPWTPASIVMGSLLLIAVVALIVWLVLRYGGRGS
jgi:hypothetical protein